MTAYDISKLRIPKNLSEIVDFLNAFYQLYSSGSLIYENSGLENAQNFVPYSNGAELDEERYDFINPMFQNDDGR